MPNALDLLVVSVESGLGLDQAVVQVAKELDHAHPEISEEFSLMTLELKAGKRRIEVKALHTLFVDPRSRRVLHKPEGGVWSLIQVGPLA